MEEDRRLRSGRRLVKSYPPEAFSDSKTYRCGRRFRRGRTSEPVGTGRGVEYPRPEVKGISSARSSRKREEGNEYRSRHSYKSDDSYLDHGTGIGGPSGFQIGGVPI
jgi:hypothetical protein